MERGINSTGSIFSVFTFENERMKIVRDNIAAALGRISLIFGVFVEWAEKTLLKILQVIASY